MLQKILRKKPGVKISTKLNLKELEKNTNLDLKSVVVASEKNSPFSIINNFQYRDFDRDKYNINSIHFPINIKVKYKRNFTHKQYLKDIKQIRPFTNQKGRPCLAGVSGNQLLVSLHNEKQYSDQEVLEMLYRLSVHPELEYVDLSRNDLLVNVIKRFYNNANQSSMDIMSEAFEYLMRLGVRDESYVQRCLKNMFVKYLGFGKLPADRFGRFFIMANEFNFYEKIGDPTKIELMKEQLARYILKMNPDMFTMVFMNCIDYEIITHHLDYLFQHHFLMNIWKKPGWLGIKNYLQVFDGLVALNFHNEDPELMVEDFLNQINKYVVSLNDVESLNKLKVKLDDIKDGVIDNSIIEDFQNKIVKWVLFCETRKKQIDDTEFPKIIQNDIAYYNLTIEDDVRKKRRSQKNL